MVARRACVTMGLLVLLALGAGPASALNWINNGGFESGLTGWMVSDEAGGSGSFYAATGPVTPASGLPTAGAAGGTMYALSDQPVGGLGGAHALWQAFTISGPATNVDLEFDLFVNNWAPVSIVNPAGLTYTAGPNQHVRVDILPGTASPFDTASVLGNYYLGVDGGPSPHAYTHFDFDITDKVGSGGTYILRFAGVENMGFLNAGVDNVGITGTPSGTQTPEPATLALLLVGGVPAVLRRRRRK